MKSANVLYARLKALAVRTITDCTFPKTVPFSDKPLRLLLPSGDEKYGAFWVRDAAMMAESLLVPAEDLRQYIALIAERGQNGAAPLYLKNGLEVPPYAVADHIGYSGRPVFYPGTMSDGDDQGTGGFGIFPPFCDNYFFIQMTSDYVRRTGDRTILDGIFSGMPLRERLRHAMDGYGTDPETGLCVSDGTRYTVNWGFVDTVRQSGRLLFASLLRLNAARRMEELFPGEGYDARAASLRQAVSGTFFDAESGWFYADDSAERQKDVWGSAYALYLRVPEKAAAEKTSRALAAAYRTGLCGSDGYIRHILRGEDALPGRSAWAHCSAPYDTYQNGGYWATPTGWNAYAIGLTDPEAGVSLLEEFAAHTADRETAGAPYEWKDETGTRFSGCRYGTSGVLPYVGLRRMAEDGIVNIL